MGDTNLVCNRLTALGSTGITTSQAKHKEATAHMADKPETPDAAADRLATALEKIARLTAVRPQAGPPVAPEPDLTVTEIVERLDSLIARLRTALGKTETTEE
ncbi:MAG TPA: hypothetical protein VFG12_12695 [Rhodopila sp.]|jgi:hypothetical protein|nr:hypothetical protein [Rhodopila sp.]